MVHKIGKSESIEEKSQNVEEIPQPEEEKKSPQTSVRRSPRISKSHSNQGSPKRSKSS